MYFIVTAERDGTPIGPKVCMYAFAATDQCFISISFVAWWRKACLYTRRLLQIGYMSIQKEFENYCFTPRKSITTLWFTSLKMVNISSIIFTILECYCKGEKIITLRVYFIGFLFLPYYLAYACELILCILGLICRCRWVQWSNAITWGSPSRYI